MIKKLENLLKSEIDPAFAARAQFIFEAIEKKKPPVILDMGCGRGFYANALSLYAFPKDIYGLDIRSEYIKKAQKESKDSRVHFEVGSIYKTQFPDEYFDAIICSEILEHLEDDKKALLEMRRILKSNGVLLITVPNYDFPFLWDPLNWLLTKIFKTHVNKNIWWLAGIWADHERLYTENKIRRLIIAIKFNIVNSKKIVSWCWPFSHFLLYGIGKNLMERFGFKSFNRFNLNRKNNIFALIFGLPNRLFPARKDSQSSVNLVYEVRKQL